MLYDYSHFSILGKIGLLFNSLEVLYAGTILPF